MFEIKSRGSTVTREVLGGLTTFLAMSYILFVQPAMLSKAGMDSGGVFMATCLASAAACILMGLWANYPIALAPGMGQNAFFVFTLCGAGVAAGAFALEWPEALALTVVVGLIFLAMSMVGFRSRLLNAIPDALKSGIAAGIGLFIALIGFEWGNIIRIDPDTYISLCDMRGNYVAILTMAGLAITFALAAWRLRGAILLGILATTALTWAVGKHYGLETIELPTRLMALPSGLGATAGQFVPGLGELWDKLIGPHWADVLALGFILLFMDIFDTVGTLVGVASRAGLITGGKLPRAERALAADAIGTVAGGALGTSTITSYIESVTGVAAGARTGLAAVVTGLCLAAAVFFQPVVDMVAAGVTLTVGDAEVVKYPMIAPALILVGALMMRTMRDIQWDDLTEAVPAFLTMVTMPFAFSISAGIAIGFVSYAFGKIITGKPGKCPVLVYVFAALFVIRYALGS